jgi:hypothetical protein
MDIHMQDVASTQANAFPKSLFTGAYKDLRKVLTRAVSRTAGGATSSPTTQLFCDKWRPEGIGLLLKDRHQWAALGCQRRATSQHANDIQ